MTDAVRRDLYPEVEPFSTGRLKVSDIHEVYFEESGLKGGKPVIFLHGGPGGGTSGRDRRFFDPEFYHIVLIDQRGAGRSTPPAELKENTTWDLVADIERLREHLGFDKWLVFGGSWGSTLSLAYAETHPDRVTALVLRGIFSLRRRELLWFYQDGASFIFPDAFDGFVAPIPETERGDLMGAYYRYLTGDDEDKKQECARAWSKWEMTTSRLIVSDVSQSKADDDKWALQFARIECHYFVHGGFFKRDSQILDNIDKIRHIPATIVQGRYDLVCPMDTAWQLHKRWPESELHIIPDAGHSNHEPGIAAQLMEATEKYKALSG